MGRAMTKAALAVIAAIAVSGPVAAQHSAADTTPQREFTARPISPPASSERSANALVTQAAPGAQQGRGVASSATGTVPGSAPFSQGGGRTLMVNGRALPRDLVFRFLPVTLPLTTMRVSSLFGMRSDPINGFRRGHGGVDFAAPAGTPVHVTAGGVVVKTGWRGDYGNAVEVRHALGFSTIYGHLSRISVTEGQQLDRHAVVGAVGSTGRSTGNHLHFEIRHENRGAIDPIRFILLAYETYRHLD